MKGKHFATNNKNNKRTKSIVLSIVALLELILLVTSFTFSWFEGLTSLELKGENFKTASALKSHVEIGENKSESDTTYTDIIDLTPYFDTQKEVRLSPVSSADGVNFYAAYDGYPEKVNTANDYKKLHYRKLSKEDINSNIIQFEFNISSPDGPTSVYFTEVMPVVYINGTARGQEGRYANPYRFAFSDGTTTTIFRTEDYVGSAANAAHKQIAISSLNADNTPVTKDKFIRRPHEFTYYSDHREEVLSQPMNSNTGIQAPINPIFNLEKGETKTITVSVWMEALDVEILNRNNSGYNYEPVPGQNISFAVKLCTSWSITRDITVYDFTADQWVDPYDENNKADTALYVRSTDGKDENNRQYELLYDEATKSWAGTIPNALQNCEFLWGARGSDGRINPNKIWARWQAPGRGNSADITFLGTNEACFWNLTPEDLISIDFRDYTNEAWINYPDEKGNPIDMAVGINYGGKDVEYSMTSAPIRDTFGKNSWSCWLPNTVNTVKFYRKGYNTENKYINFNYWIGNDRGNHTVYRAITEGDGNVGTDSSFILYVKIDDAIAETFYANNRGKSPAISFTSASNRNLWDKTNPKSNISRYSFIPREDTWPNGESELLRVPNKANLWYMSFEEKPSDGTHVTVWSRSGANQFYDVDTEMSFGVFYLFEANKNYTTINITDMQKLTSQDANNNYALLGTMDNSGSGVGTSGSATGSKETGVWGELTPPPEGSYDARFIHTTNVDSMEVIFRHDGAEFTMPMEKDPDDPTGRTWMTNAIPDTVTSGVKFKDNNGNVWTDTGENAKNFMFSYIYAITANGTNSTATGWRMPIFTEGDQTYYFKHYDASVSKVTVSYVSEEGVPFSFDMYKEYDNLTWSTYNIISGATSIKYSDGTHTWNITDFDTDNYFCYATGKSKYVLSNDESLIRVYMTDNMSWGTNCRIHFFEGAYNTSWPGNSMTHIATNNSGQKVYVALIPGDTKGIVFNNNDKGQQTVDIKSNIGDLKGWWLSGSNHYTANSWTVDAAFLNSYSQ